MFKKFFSSISESFKELQEENAEKITQKCSCCGGTMEGKTSQSSLTCPYCGSSTKNEHYKSFQDMFGASDEEEFDDVSDIESETIEDDIDIEVLADNQEDDSVYAYVEKINSLFYNGEIPGLNFARAILCSTEEECLEKLKQGYKREKSKKFYTKPHQSLEEIKQEHPNAKIVKFK
ncbi:MAG: hypothetical protein J6K97_03580 [Clostridia bacterium]|nr:hypothetical protein [Clostridia bacterium]